MKFSFFLFTCPLFFKKKRSDCALTYDPSIIVPHLSRYTETIPLAVLTTRHYKTWFLPWPAIWYFELRIEVVYWHLTDQKTDCRLSLCGDQYKLHKPYMNYIFSYQFNIFGPCDINTGTYQMMTQVERASWRLPITRLGWNIKLFIRFTDTFLKGGVEELHIYQTSVPWV